VTGLETTKSFRLRDYDLAATLTCGQAFRWQWRTPFWVGVVGRHWVRLRAAPSSLVAATTAPVAGWGWLADYLQLEADLPGILRTFPDDEPMRAAVGACRGLRLLRQEPWECLASFILSSTKQIAQIRQVIALLCERYGEPLAVPPGWPPTFAFPAAARLARATEAGLRGCRMGFRAPYLLATARRVADGRMDLANLSRLPLEEARAELMRLPGVGGKIADCVLLFACGFPRAFPLDVWVMRALRQLYFPRRQLGPQDLYRFAAGYFGPHAGYAQQYLFHYVRMQAGRPAAGGRKPER
jgi:N-glycosylase/DNA lyase